MDIGGEGQATPPPFPLFNIDSGVVCINIGHASLVLGMMS